MNRSRKSPPNESSNKAGKLTEKPLQSWKEIAAHLERDERTARRWEKVAGLPVRRHGEGKGSSVYAYPRELDAWRTARKPNANQTQLWRWSVPVAIGISSVVLGVWFIKYSPVLNPPNPLVEAAGITVRQVWTGPEVNSTGRPSPDGWYLSCSVGPNLGVRELDSGETQLLTHDAGRGQSAFYSVFSPDGLQVVYEWGKRETELRLVDVNGSQPRVLYPREPGWWVEPVDWSADARFILVRRYSGDPFSGDQTVSFQIGMVSVEDGSLRILKTVTSRRKVNLWFSPDGEYIVYDHSSQGDPAERDISVLSVTNEDEVLLVEYPGDDYVLGWTPDGGSVLVASNRSGSYDAWLVPVTEGRLDGDAVLLKRNIGRIHSLGFTSAGSFFYGQTGSFGDKAVFKLLGGAAWGHDIYTVEVDFEEAQLLRDPQLEVRKRIGNNLSPEWSPEGDYLAYVSKGLLYIRNEETGEEQQLTSELSKLCRLHWSPDGSSLLVWGTNLEGHKGWYILNRNTASVEPVPIPDRGGAVFEAQWFPDSQRIVYGRNNRLEQWAEIVQLNLETGQEEELLRLEGEGFLSFLALSPEGTKLAFTRLSLGRPGTATEVPKTISLMIKPVTGGQEAELLSVEFPEKIGSLAWSNDGRFLIFGKAKRAPPELWRIAPQVGPAEKLGGVGSLNIREPIRVHPQGGRIAFVRTEKTVEIWAMEGFLAKDMTAN